MPSPPPLRSFRMRGFEGADHVDGRGVPLDMAASNCDDRPFDEDDATAAAPGLQTVRETIGWRLTEPARRAFCRNPDHTS